MFWLSYESFSIFSDVVCQKKCDFQLKQLWKPIEMERASFFVVKKENNRTTVGI